MKQEDIIRMAREAGWGQAKPHDDCRSCGVFDLERFAALVRADERDRAMRENAYVAAEREACAKVCEAYGQMGLGANSVANAIRARGQA